MFSAAAQSQQPPSNLSIGTIDFYGMNKVPVESLRKALPFKVGDGMHPPSGSQAAEWQRQSKALGAIHSSFNFTCCDSGRVILYVGVQEAGAPTLMLHEAPRGKVRLDEEIVKASADFYAALQLAIRADRSAEDDTKGHALASDPAMLAVQNRFIEYARKYKNTLQKVLRESADDQQRGIAAQILGYVDDKQSVVNDLVYAVSDPSELVRNNSMRSLWVFTKMVPDRKHAVIRVPYEPFVSMLNSPEWSDRNKSSLALMELTQNRDPRLLAMLRRDAMDSLIQMARWKSEGHAMPARVILARIAGYSEDGMRDVFGHHEPEAIIAAASKVK
jgi:hypothetical protein